MSEIQFFVVIKRFDFCPFLYIFMTTFWLPLEMNDLFFRLQVKFGPIIWFSHLKTPSGSERLCTNDFKPSQGFVSIYFFWKVRWSPHSPSMMSAKDERSYLLPLKHHVAAETEDYCTTPHSLPAGLVFSSVLLGLLWYFGTWDVDDSQWPMSTQVTDAIN